MRLPEVDLDDRRFQDLVNEARLRIAQSCPEWTEHNVSDPGVTLIELFAWMTETLIYRVNRIPEKLHVALLDLVGIRLDPPSAARTDLRFRLAAPPEEPVEIVAGSAEAGTLRTASEEAIVFQTDEDFVIPAARPRAYIVERGGAAKDVGVAAGTAKPKGQDQFPFGSPPAVGDALYLGFDVPLARMLLQVEVGCSQARGAGVDPEDPPLRWEVSTADGWTEAAVLADSTGGFNYGSGVVELQLPDDHKLVPVAGKRIYAVRCRVDSRSRSGRDDGGAFQSAPEIFEISAAPVGALVPASHSATEQDEILGESDGTPGQVFSFRYAPVLRPAGDETLEVLDRERDRWERWQPRESFVESGPNDRHFTLDLSRGEVELGPAIRTPDGGWHQYGAVPPKGALLRFTAYRRGGGRQGNVAPGTLNVLKSAIPGVASVTNPEAARGGVDPETLVSARARAAMELRTRYRAVTAEDFEFLAGEASARVARSVCVPPLDGEPIRVHILPRVEPADRKLEFAELTPDEDLLAEVAAYLDERRVIGTTVELVPVKLRGLSVVVNLQASPSSDLQRVEEDVAYALYTYLNPIVGGSSLGPGEGWGFGRALNQGELFHIVHSIEGVDFVKILRVYETDLATGKQEPKPVGTHVRLEPEELVASGSHIVKAELPEV